MKKYLFLIRNLAGLICLFTFVCSCEQVSEPSAKPKVVRKKIIAKTVKPAPSSKVKSATPTKSKPKTQPQPLRSTPKSQQPEKSPQKPKATRAPLIAKKDKTVSSQKPEPKPAKAKKPAMRPKSDIAVTKQPIKGQKPKPSGKAKQAETKVAATTPSDATTTAAAQPPSYKPRGKIDPFEPLFKEKKVVAKAKTKKKRKKRIPRIPLEKIDLSQLKLVAIILAKSGNRAMVEEASGKGYVISKGTYIGTNAGRVVNIEKDKVIVAEEIEDVRGDVSIRNKALKLPKPPGEL